MIRSNLLTYWTGRNIERDPDNLNEETRGQYVERLWSILDEGIWMNRNPEKVIGWRDEKFMSYIKQETGYDDGNTYSTIGMEIPMVCFTELRLSQSQPHRARYGLLGLVVDRKFVLERHGSPVLYVRSHPDESIAGNLYQVLHWIRDQSKRETDYAKEVLDSLIYSLAYLKPMSNLGIDDYENMDENEWRIVHNHKREEKGLIISTGQKKPEYKIPLKPTDLKMIVLPDSKVRDHVIEDERVVDWFKHKFPPFLTVEEIQEF